jgi:hypothetical protein
MVLFALETKERYGTRDEIRTLEKEYHKLVGELVGPDPEQGVKDLGVIRKDVTRMVRKADKELGLKSRKRKKERHTFKEAMK